MARIPEEEIAEIRRKADIADIIGRYIPVQKQGREFKAVCPFHDDHDPSLHINTEHQFYKCFVCNAGGNVFTFVQNYEHVSFPEAVGKVAELIGHPLSVNTSAAPQKVDPEKARYYKVLEEAISFTCYEINSEEASAAKKYLNDRGLDENVRNTFSIGYNPGGDRLSTFLRAKGYSDADMVAVNVARTGTQGVGDVYSNRITFPIHDAHGHPIGFSARTMDPNNPSKYVNTTDTVLFHKSDIVYNAHRARMAARREGKIYVCEGVTDVIAFARAGIENAVCTLGTACTKSQIRLLKSLAPRIVFCYDGDNAGQNATMKAGRLARSEGCDVSVVDNRTGLDPDELLKQNGPEGLKQAVRTELMWIEFVLKYLKERTNLDNYQERKKFASQVKEEIDTLDDEMDRRYFTEELSRLTGFQMDYEPKRETKPMPRETGAARVEDGLVSAEEQILAAMLGHKEAAQHFSEKLGFLQDKVRDAVAILMIDSYRTEDVLDPAALIDRAETQEEKNLIIRLIGHWAAAGPYDEGAMDGAIRKVNISLKRAQADNFREQLASDLNKESTKVLLEEYRECLNDLRRYIDEEN